MAQNNTTGGGDLASRFEGAALQFKGLNTGNPGQWPILPRLAAWALVTAAVVALGWVALLSGKTDELQAERDREPGLKQDYRGKLGQAVNLDELKKQKVQVLEFVAQLEKQLPGKAEMDALLSDINQAGLGQGLLFELFRPGSVEVKDYYAELPIALRVTGRYHDFGKFASEVAKLSRIVTLHNISIAPASGKDATGALAMEATARTYRYLDPNEVAQQRKVAQEKDKAKGAKK